MPPLILCKSGNGPAVSAPPKQTPPPTLPEDSSQTVPAAGTQLQGTQNLVQALGTAYDLGSAASTNQLSSRRFPQDFFNVAFTVLNATSGQMLNYWQLMKHSDFKEAWTHTLIGERVRTTFPGIGGHIAKPTNTCFFIDKQ